MRTREIATLARTHIENVVPVSDTDIKIALRGKIDDNVMEVITAARMDGAEYAQVGDEFYYDDPLFGEVVSIRELAYNNTLGLHRK